MLRPRFHLTVWLALLALMLAACGGAPAAAPPATAAPTLAPGRGTLYALVPAESAARFTLGEILRGNPTTVVGTTVEVSGQLRFDPADLSDAAVGPITVGAASLTTDSDLRNRAIQSRILFTGQNPTITYTPTALRGLPASVAVGNSVSFQIDGDLRILATTLPVTFDATVTYVSAARISGTATAVVRYADFDVRVPSVPAVAGVDELVELTLDFVAVPAE